MNAKEEFLEVTKGLQVKCCQICFMCEENAGVIKLPVNFSNEDYFNFLEAINKDYDDGFGCQNLFGTIWLKDGMYIDRHEYDGSEEWVIRKVPEIPDYLRSNEDIVTIEGIEYEFIEDEDGKCSDCIQEICDKVKCSPDGRTDKKNGYWIKKEK